MNRLGLWLLLVLCLAGIARMLQVWIRTARDHQNALKLCESRECLYFTDYLQKGPADLSHAQYHSALQSLEFWENRSHDYIEEFGRDSAYSGRMAKLYRRQARRA